MTTPYRNLVTRPTGAAVRNRIEQALARSDCHTAFLDFSDVELLDLSCADEIVAKLLMAEVAAGPLRGAAGPPEDQHEAIEHVLTPPPPRHRGGPHGDGGPRLLGWVTSDARAAFACICDRGSMGADEAGAGRWAGSRPRAAEALDALALHRLVRPDGDPVPPLPIA